MIRPNHMEQEFKYFAFISYSSKDTVWGKRLQRKLENYRMPATLCSERGWKRKPINPIFFAPTDIQPGGLDNELQERLKDSRNLIVVCSPNSARSNWVGQEIEYFHQLGRTNKIHFFIVDGKPHSGDPDTECFNPVVNKLGMPEILGANIHEKVFRWSWLNRERAYVQLISKLLGVEFDSIWRRHRRQLINKCMVWALGIITILLALWQVWLNNQPFDAHVTLKEATVHNEHLPPLHEAVVTMILDNETKTDTIMSLDKQGIFTNIPHRLMGKEVHVTFSCRDFISVDTVVKLTKQIKLDVNRNPEVYGDIRLTLWSDGPLPGNTVNIAGHEVTSDSEGVIRLQIPLAEQRTFYRIAASLPLVNDTLFMPCGDDDILEMKLP